MTNDTPVLNKDEDEPSSRANESLLGRISDIFKSAPKQDASLRGIVEQTLEENEDVLSDVSDEERSLLRQVLKFGEIVVEDVMIPRSDIIAVEEDISLDDLVEVTKNKGRHTRLPVYQDNLDKITGFIHTKDLVPILSNGRILKMEKIQREIMFVSPAMRVMDLLVKMRISGDHIAIVVDEYGGTNGLVTMEDIVEEIVGEIQDEHDEAEEFFFRKLSDKIFVVNARIEIADLERVTGENFKIENNMDADYDTLGGLIFFLLGRVPGVGEIVKFNDDLEFEILEADPRRIKTVKIMKK